MAWNPAHPLDEAKARADPSSHPLEFKPVERPALGCREKGILVAVECVQQGLNGVFIEDYVVIKQ
jgi:hypothetical protein